MNPARSLILFTTLSGLGLGLLAWLGIDPTPPTGWVALVFFAIAHGLTLTGLAASALHLGRRERALRAFSQWRTSWLSREAWAAAVTLTLTGLYGGLLILGIHVAPLGWLGALLALGTVGVTSMIYAQLKTVPRWHRWTTPALFLAYAVTGGALLSGRVTLSEVLLPVTAALQLYAWWDGDRRFARSGTTLATATGLDAPRALFPPHSGPNYLLKEMVFVVGRRHAMKLRVIALFAMAVIPLAFLAVGPSHFFGLLALVTHALGVFLSRWLFFAEAEHVVGLYYGRR